MAKVLINDTSLQNLADSIREKTGTTGTMKPSEMAGKIAGIVTPTGETSITQNGTYDVTDYASASVNVASSGDYNTKIEAQANMTIQNAIREVESVTISYSGYNFFSNCQYLKKVGSIDMSTCNNATNMFAYCYRLTDLPNELDCSGLTSASCMFQKCRVLPTIPTLKNININFDVSYMFSECKAITSVPNLDFSNATSAKDIFSSCNSLTSIPNLDFSNATSMQNAFRDCSAITTVGVLTTPSVTSFYDTFSYCSNLERIEGIDTSSCTNFREMFYGCEKLTHIPMLDMTNATDVKKMFNLIRGIPSECAYNIIESLKTATNYTGTKTLNYAGLSYCANIIKAQSNWADLEAMGWSEN